MGSSVFYGGDFDTNDTSRVIKYTETDFNTLKANITGQKIGAIAETINSVGFGLVFGLGKPSGFYRWDGADWVFKGKKLQDAISTNIDNITSNDTDILDLQDNKLDRGDYTGTGEDLRDDINRLTAIWFIESEMPLLTQEDIPDYQRYFGVLEDLPNVNEQGEWIITLPYTGTYSLDLFQILSTNTTTSNFESHLLIDGSVFTIPLHIELKDSAGTGIDVPVIANNELTGLNLNTGTDQLVQASGRRVIFRNAGDQITIRYEFASQIANQRATVHAASVFLRYTVNSNVESVPPSIGTASIAYNAFTNGFTGNITVTNNSGSNISSFDVVLNGVNWDVINSFNAEAEAIDLDNGVYMFSVTGFLGALADGQTKTFGFFGSTGQTGQVQTPSNTSISISGS